MTPSRIPRTCKPLVLCTILLMIFILLEGAFFICLSAGDVVVAMVNNTQFYKSQLDHSVSEYLRITGKKNINIEERMELLKGLIRRQLILKSKDVEKIRKDPAIIQQVKMYEDQLVMGRFINEKVGKPTAISEDEMKAYYQSHLIQFASPPKVKSSHILLRSRSEAEAVFSKIMKGANFSQLAKEYSIDLPMALEGGSMGVIEKGRGLPEIEKVLFLMKEGEISEIVETRYGFHILTVNEIITEKYKPFDEVSEDIRKILFKEKEAKAFNQMVSEIEKTATITIFENIIGGN